MELKFTRTYGSGHAGLPSGRGGKQQGIFQQGESQNGRIRYLEHRSLEPGI